MPRFPHVTKPTIAFIGVTTGSSSILRVFPAWARMLDLDVEIVGVDFEPRSDPAAYRGVVEELRDNPLLRGAMVTTHKISLYDACRDVFDEIDPHAAAFGEVSCISKRGTRLRCDAKDAITAGLALDGLLPSNYFAAAPTDVFVMGAGGSSIAVTWHLMRERPGIVAPARIFVSDRDPDRLAEIERIHETIASEAERSYVRASGPEANDATLAQLRPGSLVVNATGLGKDAPGSPLTSAAQFPINGIAWDLNYRGELVFLEQARTQALSRALRVENGWTYFIHGWLAAIAEVFDIAIPSVGTKFDELARVASEASMVRV